MDGSAGSVASFLFHFPYDITTQTTVEKNVNTSKQTYQQKIRNNGVCDATENITKNEVIFHSRVKEISENCDEFPLNTCNTSYALQNNNIHMWDRKL